ncbi:hypothetical protein ABZ891_12675 [Streptomyces sp. NPDC047023]|uniref:hypothetical protein n=1 Tax=Streptomyces sp. NPDC047023 TaxID=3155139 RepID=UPI0034007912
MAAPQKKKANNDQPTPPIPSEEPVLGVLCGRQVRILPVQQWRASALKALREGDLDAWAERCLTDEGLDVWDAVDPTFAEVSEFFASFSDEMAVTETGAPPPNRATRRAAPRRRR